MSLRDMGTAKVPTISPSTLLPQASSYSIHFLEFLCALLPQCPCTCSPHELPTCPICHRSHFAQLTSSFVLILPQPSLSGESRKAYHDLLGLVTSARSFSPYHLFSQTNVLPNLDYYIPLQLYIYLLVNLLHIRLETLLVCLQDFAHEESFHRAK